MASLDPESHTGLDPDFRVAYKQVQAAVENALKDQARYARTNIDTVVDAIEWVPEIPFPKGDDVKNFALLLDAAHQLERFVRYTGKERLPPAEPEQVSTAYNRLYALAHDDILNNICGEHSLGALFTAYHGELYERARERYAKIPRAQQRDIPKPVEFDPNARSSRTGIIR